MNSYRNPHLIPRPEFVRELREQILNEACVSEVDILPSVQLRSETRRSINTVANVFSRIAHRCLFVATHYASSAAEKVSVDIELGAGAIARRAQFTSCMHLRL